MADNKEFIIPIKGLKIGKHNYNFQMDGSFFKELDNSQILDADLQADVELDKGSGWMNINSRVFGNVVVECDRCLDDLTLPVDFKCSMSVKFSKSLAGEGNDEFIIIDPTDGELDLRQFLYDYVCVNLPLQKVHKEGECNKEVMAKLNELNSAVVEEQEEDTSNSPFGALKEMLKDKKF
jgi:Predicted metal-binding, possibly nucleic acid-binding protein